MEYLGRIDTQVKVRGYRIELTEIESVLSEAPDVAQAVVGTHEPEPGTVELVAYYTRRNADVRVDRDELRRRARERLPAYMVPAYFEELDAIPMLPSDKADRKSLPRRPPPAPPPPRTAASPPRTTPNACSPTRSPASCAWTACPPTATSSTTSARTRC
ncbi:amino acid adenylation domain-containing protein [Actinomadura sp. J1-007]|uniref:amino acid adenylation domain-containing protein n=1 Tax=Actinomadura sp. J1-007 TaxID=2661913 RepID=UPI00136E24E3|nr:amino acid adenylation domain-containing protein [Actinomadura sp. J1-007]